MTREIASQGAARSPHWRVSLATIDSDGPFSQFPGVRRSLALACDGRLVLRGVTSAPCVLESMGDIITFDGMTPVEARCEGGPVMAFNLMARPGSTARLDCHRRAFTLPAGRRFVLLPLRECWTLADAVLSPGMVACGACGDRPTPVVLNDVPAGCMLAASLPLISRQEAIE